MPRLFAIGDIHGHHTALASLLDRITLEPGDTVITLGDQISGGPNSKAVVEELLNLSARARLIPLLGNHELLMLGALQNRAIHKEWMVFGGESILSSYGIASLREIPEAHWEFLRSCVPYHEEEAHIFVHALVDPQLPMEIQPNRKLFWEKLKGNLTHSSGKTIICGHTPQQSGRPLRLESTICIDTNIKGGGWLTCLEPETGRYWQADQEGRLREAQL